MISGFNRFSTRKFRALLLRSLIFVIKAFIFLGDTTSYILKAVCTVLIKHIIALAYLVDFTVWSLVRGCKSVFRFVFLVTRTAVVAIVTFPLTLGRGIVRAIRVVTVGVLSRLRMAVRLMSKVQLRVPRIHSPEAHQKKPVSHRRKYIYFQILYILVLMGAGSILLYRIYIFFQELPSPVNIGKTNYSLTTHIYDRNGKDLYGIYSDENRTPIKLHAIPSYVSQATIAIEDKDFYVHVGVSPIGGIARALKDWLTRRQVQGGSTITQQLVKMSLLSSERTLTRKVKEALIALETERMYTKDQILEMYLNQVPYGGSAYGVEEASRTFFGKSSQALSLAEAALLAGLPQAPTTYSPFVNPDSAINRRNQVLKAMYDQQFISDTQYRRALTEKPQFIEPTTSILAPHFVFYTKKHLEQYFDEVDLEKSGLKVYTSLDLDIQQKAQTILQEELEKVQYLNVTNGGILVTNPKTGEILAMVGSSGYFTSDKYGAFNVTTALRQPGSSFKPLLYAYSLQRGYTSATLIDDTATTFLIPGSEPYKPVNYDGRFHGRVTFRSALANSYNIPAVKLMEKAGVANVIDFAKHVGIDTWEDPSRYGLSLSLGGGEVTMIDMAEAYSVLANEGIRTNVNPVHKIQDPHDSQVILEHDEPEQIIDPAYTYIISDILSDNQARIPAFGPGSQLEIPGRKVAVKTGTTDSKKDNWTIGYTPDYLVVVWVGNNDGTPMNPFLTSGVTGAAPIWHRVMQYLLDDKSKTDKWYDKPGNIVQKPCMGRVESFIMGTETTVPCSMPTPPNLVKSEEKNKTP